MYVCISVNMYVWLLPCSAIHTYMHTYIHTYIHIHIILYYITHTHINFAVMMPSEGLQTSLRPHNGPRNCPVFLSPPSVRSVEGACSWGWPTVSSCPQAECESACSHCTAPRTVTWDTGSLSSPQSHSLAALTAVTTHTCLQLPQPCGWFTCNSLRIFKKWDSKCYNTVININYSLHNIQDVFAFQQICTCQDWDQIHILESITNTTRPYQIHCFSWFQFKYTVQIQLQFFNSNTNTLPCFLIQIRFKYIAIFYLI